MENQNPQQTESGFVTGFLKFLPVIQWIVMIIIAVCVFVLSQRDMQTAQAQEVKDSTRKIVALEIYNTKREAEIDRQFEQLRREMLTREVFGAYHAADSARMDRMEKMLEQMIVNQNAR